MTRGSAIASCLGLLAALTLSIAGCGSTGHAESGGDGLSITGVFPDFDEAETRYVSRCGRNGDPVHIDTGTGTKVAVGSAAPRTGSFSVDPGARPGEDFEITVSDSGDPGRYQVRCLPADFPEWHFQQLNPIGPGLFVVGFNASSAASPWVIVFDHEGVPRWWFSPDTRVLWAQILRDGNFEWARSFGDGYGLNPHMADEVRTESGKLLRVVRADGEIIDGHEFRELGNGNVLVDAYAPGPGVDMSPYGGPKSAWAVFGEVQEIDPEGHLVWSWNSRGKIHPSETGRWWRNILSNAKPGVGGAPTYDIVHINSIDPRGPNELVVSMRHTDAVYGISRATGEIRWKLGGTETDDSLQVIGDPAKKIFGGQHDARVEPDGDLSIYDNGKDRPRRPRAVFFHLDLDKGTATYLGQLNDPAITKSHCCGSVRPLEGGGWLVSWGDNPLVTAFDDQGQTAFRLKMAASAFRAVPVPEGATTVAKLSRAMEEIEHDEDTP